MILEASSPDIVEVVPSKDDGQILMAVFSVGDEAEARKIEKKKISNGSSLVAFARSSFPRPLSNRRYPKPESFGWYI